MRSTNRIARIATITFVLGLLAAAAAPRGWAQNASATDAAYAAGYSAGYPLGQQDQASGTQANAHKFRVYQDATEGYTDAYGTREQYRVSFQSGFDDGYQDGYAGRPRSIAAGNTNAAPAPAATPAPPVDVPPAPGPGLSGPPPSADPNVTAARGNGYRDGYSVGQADANRNATYNATASHDYQDAMTGYNRMLGAPDQYQLNFRSGFQTGYDDGYHHRLYQSAMGARPMTPPPDAASASTHGNLLPTDPARLASLSSGVYDNGILIAQGTPIHGTLDRTLDTKYLKAGDAFSITTTIPVWVGAVAAIPAGSTIQGTVEQVTRGGKAAGAAQLQLQYNTITVPGQPPIALNATTSSVGAGADKVNSDEGTVNGQGSGAGKSAAKGAALGAILGGIFGGGGGLIRGGIAGAAVGTAGAIISHKKDLVLNQGEPVMVSLQQPLVLPRN